jgi:Protein of unknown function (DUF3619)
MINFAHSPRIRAAGVADSRSAAEDLLARRLAMALSAASARVPDDIQQRLQFGRQQALAGAAQRRRVLASERSVATGGSGSALVMAGGPGSGGWWQRLGTAIPLIVLVVGLYGIDQWQLRESVLAAADVDALLLADDLPPVAYTDPGFGEFLHTTVD